MFCRIPHFFAEVFQKRQKRRRNEKNTCANAASVITMLVCGSGRASRRRESRAYQNHIAYDANNFVMHASTGNTAVVKLFLAAGMPPDAQSTTGWTPLIGAASRGKKETARILIAAGANVNARTLNNETPVFMAVMGSDVDTVKELLAMEQIHRLKRIWD